MAGLVVGSTVVALVCWARVRGGPVLAGVQRVGLVLAAQVAAVLLVAVALNNYGYFYGSWSDLFGSGSPTAAPAASPPAGHFGRNAAVVSTVMADQQAWSTPSQYPSRGRVEDIRIRGERSGLSGELLVYLPPQYFQPRYSHRQFPAVEVMTGYPGITAGLVSRMHYPDVLLTELASRRAHPMVLVMLRPTVAPPRDTECTDVPGGPLAMTYLAEDIPAAVDGMFRVRPIGWGTMGDSTGGYCAVKEAMTHSDVFSAAVSLSGYYHTIEDSTTGDLWGGSPVVRDLNSPEWLLAHQPAPPVSVFTTIGLAEQGHTGLSDTRRFLALVRPPMTATSEFVPGGGHNFANWGKVMPAALDWLSQRLGA